MGIHMNDKNGSRCNQENLIKSIYSIESANQTTLIKVVRLSNYDVGNVNNLPI
jgi:hypothetical protein